MSGFSRLTKSVGCVLGIFLLTTVRVAARGSNDNSTGIQKVSHIVVLMQENHSFDNYFGVLAYAPGTPYHPPSQPGAPCDPGDQTCVDGLTCTRNGGTLSCTNFNVKTDGTSQHFASHNLDYCTTPDPKHDWESSHREGNFDEPNDTLHGTSDGFLRVNDDHEDTMNYYNEADLPYYYALAQTFAISDRMFSSLIGPTLPNRLYLLAATSFGHVVTGGEIAPPAQGYKPVAGTIFDLLSNAGVSWTNYYDPETTTDPTVIPARPYGGLFFAQAMVVPPHFKTMDGFFTDAAAGTLPAVSFVDLKHSEHPAGNIRAGQHEVAQVINAVRTGPNWPDTVIFFTYDEHGGFYDHVTPPAAARPDQYGPGQCGDLSNPPQSTQPGSGANCNSSKEDAQSLCALVNPGEPCAGFDQLGFRVPFIAVSPFAKPGYVSHTVGDHTSILAFIEKRFLNGQPLTRRDARANTLEDLFDFGNAPSLNANVSPSLAAPPSPQDPGCSAQ